MNKTNAQIILLCICRFYEIPKGKTTISWLRLLKTTTSRSLFG